MSPEVRRSPLYLGVSLVTGATLVLQLTLTRLFSVTMYYHFAFLAISLALFGLGMSGIYLYLRPQLGEPGRFRRLLSRHSLIAAATTVLALLYILRQKVSLESWGENLWLLASVYLVCALPFFFAGVCVSLVVQAMQGDMGRVYCFDLTGAAAGCLVLIPALNLLGAPGTAVLAALLFAAANLLFQAAFAPVPAARWLPGVVAVAVLGAGLGLDRVRPFLELPEVKAMEGEVLFDGWNSFSRVTVEEEPGADHLWLRMDAAAATRIFSGELEKQDWEPVWRFSWHRHAGLVYRLRHAGKALIIGPGGGADIIMALAQGVPDITAVELNPLIARDVMGERFLEYSGRLYARPQVTAVVDDGRSFIRSSSERYDSIQASLVDTWAATAAGAFALSENNLYTTEAFVEYLEHLTADGILSFTRWDWEFLRLLALGRAGLEGIGVSAGHSAHFVIASDRGMGTALLKRTPFTEAEVAALAGAAEAGGIELRHTPFQPPAHPYSRFLRAADWRSRVAESASDISPPTDDRPFFFYSIKPGQLLQALGQAEELQEDSLKVRNNLGIVLLAALLGIVLVLVTLFFVLPLVLLRRDAVRENRGRKARFLAYFIAVGVGFITVEIVLLQKTVLFLGHPVYALTVVLFALLVSAGLGSFLVRDVPAGRIRGRVLGNFALFVLLVLGCLAAMSPLFEALVGLARPLRMLVTVGLLAPLGLLMGTFLPLAIRSAGDELGGLVPWAWGLNGAASVLGSVLAVFLAMNLGFNVTLIVGLLAYCLGLLAWRPGSAAAP